MDKVLFFIVFILVTAFLFIAHKRQWWSRATFDALLVAATVGSVIAAVFVFIIPAAQPTPENKDEGNPKTNTQNLNSNQSVKSAPLSLENANSNTSSKKSIPPNLITANTNRDNAYEEASITVNAGRSGRAFNGEIIISVQSVSVEEQVTATIGSPGFPNKHFDQEGVGSVMYYKGRRIYEVRITSVEYVGSRVDFLVITKGQ